MQIRSSYCPRPRTPRPSPSDAPPLAGLAVVCSIVSCSCASVSGRTGNCTQAPLVRVCLFVPMIINNSAALLPRLFSICVSSLIFLSCLFPHIYLCYLPLSLPAWPFPLSSYSFPLFMSLHYWSHSLADYSTHLSVLNKSSFGMILIKKQYLLSSVATDLLSHVNKMCEQNSRAKICSCFCVDLKFVLFIIILGVERLIVLMF